MQQLRRYETKTTATGRVAWTGPIMVGGRLVLANSVGDVVAVSPAERPDAWQRADVDQPVFIPPIAANGQIYIVTDEARLVVFQ